MSTLFDSFCLKFAVGSNPSVAGDEQAEQQDGRAEGHGAGGHRLRGHQRLLRLLQRVPQAGLQREEGRPWRGRAAQHVQVEAEFVFWGQWISASIFRSLDTDGNGFVLEEDLRKLMTGKAGITNDDIKEMIEEYKKLDVNKTKKSNENISEDVIFYQGWAKQF